ncbi:hypothetical protein D3C86_1037840 [compost metagenome]
MPAASAPWVKDAEVWPPCRPPVVSEDCWSTSATLVKPRVWMSSAVMDITGVWVSRSVCGISEPVTVTLSSVVAFSCAMAGAAAEAIRAENSAAASVLRREVEL